MPTSQDEGVADPGMYPHKEVSPLGGCHDGSGRRGRPQGLQRNTLGGEREQKNKKRGGRGCCARLSSPVSFTAFSPPLRGGSSLSPLLPPREASFLHGLMGKVWWSPWQEPSRRGQRLLGVLLPPRAVGWATAFHGTPGLCVCTQPTLAVGDTPRHRQPLGA